MITQLWDTEQAIELGIPRSDKSLFYKWERDGRQVFFSISQMGDSLICHLAADRKGKRALRTAINQMAQYFFMTFPAVNQVVSHAFMNSMKNTTRKLGFEFLLAVPDDKADNSEFHIMVLKRSNYGW